MQPFPFHVPQFLRAPLDASGGDAALPSWDLSDLYAGPQDPSLAADLERAEAHARDFQVRHATRLTGASGDTLAAAIAEYEAIEEVLGRAMSFAQLLFSSDAQDAENGRFYARRR
jgi:oligoendopeptidase F